MESDHTKFDKKITRNWFKSDLILPQHQNIEVRQVSCWIIRNKKAVIISKDEIKWSIPGGHPESGETIKESLDREIMEESGVDISNREAKLIGYYLIEEETPELKETFLQLRYYVEMSDLSELQLKPSELDKVKFCKLVDFEEFATLVKWANDSEDFKNIKDIFK